MHNKIKGKILKLNEIKTKINEFEPKSNDEKYMLLACQEAYKAYESGNFGIGAILVDENGSVVSKGHNSVFNPSFRSDLHAEMVVMNQFESHHITKQDLSKYTLYTSLEPCPMCLARVITAGVGTVKYACVDKDGGMVSRILSFPPVWQEIASDRNFTQALISSELQKIASELFLSNVAQLDNILKNNK